MRLKTIKLAGFKSFVDPTTINLPSQLIGIVGPNGCGKSNVIDAVSWVLGESSAKHLRGASLEDVIFNGSTVRKPVGHATIELIFDNSDGTLVGQYAQYSEISIKRHLSRDGQSVYYLNGGRCRRRDITDIFLGTGLGPRSYAIIEQGTVTRLIEAKPEELRVFLEEAAGISKYKERRRETESRIRATRENISRLEDLLAELNKRLETLQRQAKTAEKYKQAKQEERLLKAQLLALRWDLLKAEADEQNRGIATQETAIEAQRAALLTVETEIEKQRDRHNELNETFNQVQGRFYGVGERLPAWKPPFNMRLKNCRKTATTSRRLSRPGVRPRHIWSRTPARSNLCSIPCRTARRNWNRPVLRKNVRLPHFPRSSSRCRSGRVSGMPLMPGLQRRFRPQKWSAPGFSIWKNSCCSVMSVSSA